MQQWKMPALPGAGALHSSAHDLAIFVQSQLGLVPSSLFSIMIGTQRPLADTQLPKHVINLGWHVRMTKIIQLFTGIGYDRRSRLLYWFFCSRSLKQFTAPIQGNH